MSSRERPPSDGSPPSESSSEESSRSAIRGGEHGAEQRSGFTQDSTSVSYPSPVRLRPTDDEGSVEVDAIVRSHLAGVIEAVLFASEQPMTSGEIAQIADADWRLVRSVIIELQAFYKNRGINLVEIGGGFTFRTSPAFSPFARRVTSQKPVKLTRAQLETLAVVAYRQPMTRPEVDEVRGVDSGAVLRMLLERGMLRILGKKNEPGRPLLYGTSKEFLRVFGLKSLRDLPSLREFAELNEESRRTFEKLLGEPAPEQLEWDVDGGEMKRAEDESVEDTSESNDDLQS